MISSAEIEETKDNAPKGFVDPETDENWFLLKNEAQDRAKAVNDVSYKVAVSLMKGGGTYHGVVDISFNQTRLLENPSDDKAHFEGGHLFFDYKGRQVKSVIVNGKSIELGTKNVFYRHKLFVPKALQ